MNKKRFCLSMVVVAAIAFGTVSLGPAWSQGTTASIDQAAETITLKIEGWTCRSCEKDIRRVLLAVPGVKAADVSYPRGGAIVAVERGRVRNDQLLKAVESAGTVLSTYRASVIPNGSLLEAGGSGDDGGSFFKRLFQ